MKELDRLLEIIAKIAAGRYTNDVMELTGSGTAEPIRTIADAMGLMMVKVEAREYHLEMLINQLEEMNQQVRRNAIATVSSMAKALAARDAYTQGHAERVGQIVGLIAAEMELTEEETESYIRCHHERPDGCKGSGKNNRQKRAGLLWAGSGATACELIVFDSMSQDMIATTKDIRMFGVIIQTKGGLLMSRIPILPKIACISLALGLMLFVGELVYGAKNDKNSEKKPVITEAELQSHVMSFADRFAAVMVTSFDKFEAGKAPQKDRHEVLALVTYSISNAYVIAGESDPDVALLDIVSMVTLGRIILEEEGPSRYGKRVQPVAQGFRTAEKDILEIAAIVLTPDQLADLMSTIKRWRKENPGVTFFPPIRFSDFAADRRGSHLTKTEGKGGLFKSVEAATEQVEEMRLLAERGMYLATRMPQMTGLFAELWLTRLLKNPNTAKVLADVSTLSAAADRLAAAAEKLPDQIAVERNTTIRQAMKSIAQERNSTVNQIAAALSTERKAALDAFASEEARIRGLLADLRETLTTGNEFIGAVNTLATQFKSVSPSEPAKPFDIRDYQTTLAELSNSAQELTKLATSLERISDKIGADQLIPQVVHALDRAESEGEELIDHTMRQMILLIVIGLIGYIIARLFIQYFSTKMNTSAK